METKRGREDEVDGSPDRKKVRTEVVCLLDDSNPLIDSLISETPSAEHIVTEERYVANVMRNLEEVLQGPTVSAQTSGSEKEPDIPASDSGCDDQILDPLLDDDGFLTTDFPGDLLTEIDFSATGCELEACQIPETGSDPSILPQISSESVSVPSGSPLGYLLGASDDDLGLPLPESSGRESPTDYTSLEHGGSLAVDDWRYDDEFQTMCVPDIGFCDAYDGGEEAEEGCAVGGLFDHSNVADGGFAMFSGKANAF